MPTKEIKIGDQFTRALIQNKSFNPETNTFDIIIATETPIFIIDPTNENHNEILICDPSNIKMERASNGLPFLRTHPKDSFIVPEDVLGKVFNIRCLNKQLIGSVTLGSNATPQLKEDIKNGIIDSVSVGFRAFRAMRIDMGEDVPMYKITEWEPNHVAVAPIPADFKSLIRSKETDGNHTVIIDNYSHSKSVEKMEETQVSEETREQKPANPAVAAPAEKVDVAKIRQEATEAQKARIDAILKSTRAAKLSDTEAIEFINSEKTIEEIRQAVIEKYIATDPKIDANQSIQVGKEAIEKKRAAAEQAVLHRIAPKHFELAKVEGARDMAGLSIHEIACVLAGERSGKMEFVGKLAMAEQIFSKRSQSTSDFPLLLEALADKLLRADYTFAPEFWDMIARQTSNQDFRAKNLYQVESVNGMKEIAEGGEINYTKLEESKQTIRVKKYAEGIKFTREAYINDDLNAFSLIPNRFVLDWNTLRGDLVWGMLTNNVVMDDAKPLFDAAHKNILTGATSGLDDIGLTAALKLFRAQTGLDGKRKIRVSPKFLIVSPDLEIVAKKLLAFITPTAVGDVNVWINSYTIIVEPRLTGNQWYLAADPSQIEGLYYSYLQGNSGLRSNREDDFDSDSIKFAVRSEFGVAAIDYRGWLRAAGGTVQG